MDNFIPDMYQKSIYTINYQKLKNNGIKCLLFDLDNTIVPIKLKEPTKKNKELFNDLKKMGFKVIIFSNSPKKKLQPFKQQLLVDCSASSLKPLKIKFLKVMEMFDYYESDVAIIGDQLLTDIYGGNKVGITTILVNPISMNDLCWTFLNRKIEKIIYKKLAKKEILKKGKYYD